MRFVFAAILVVLIVPVTSVAGTNATPKPYQWTPAQAAAAIRAYGEDLYPDANAGGGRQDLTAVTCRGTGPKVAGRFMTFRCSTTFDEGTRATMFAKTRRAGGLCFTMKLPVPSGCLASGARAKGNMGDAAGAVYRQLGAPAQSFGITAHGSGFYSWTWSSGGVEHHGTVVFSPTAVMKVLG